MASPILLIRYSWVNESLPAFQIELKPSDLRDNRCLSKNSGSEVICGRE